MQVESSMTGAANFISYRQLARVVPLNVYFVIVASRRFVFIFPTWKYKFVLQLYVAYRFIALPKILEIVEFNPIIDTTSNVYSGDEKNCEL